MLRSSRGWIFWNHRDGRGWMGGDTAWLAPVTPSNLPFLLPSVVANKLLFWGGISWVIMYNERRGKYVGRGVYCLLVIKRPVAIAKNHLVL
ncbi:hypothetical protein BJX64DRAFT_210852 [Aspergillus heterothallicus]